MADLVAITDSGISGYREPSAGLSYELKDKSSINFYQGTSVEEARTFTKVTLSIAKEATSDLDIATLDDIDGSELALSLVKAIRISSAKTNVAAVTATTDIVDGFGDLFDGTLELAPSASVLFVNPSETGFPLSGGSIIEFENLSTVASATITVTILGV